MKKIFSILILTFVLVSCSKSEEQNLVISQISINGTWKLNSIVKNSVEQATECDLEFGKFIFNEDYSAIEFFGRVTDVDCIQQSGTNTYSINLNVLTIKESVQDSYVYEAKYYISELSASELKLKLFYTKQSNPSGGIDVTEFTESEQETYHYNRQ
jgi:hypothetical protein